MDEWTEQRTEIGAQIAEGYTAAERGELIDAEQVRSRLNELKRKRIGGPLPR